MSTVLNGPMYELPARAGDAIASPSATDRKPINQLVRVRLIAPSRALRKGLGRQVAGVGPSLVTLRTIPARSGCRSDPCRPTGYYGRTPVRDCGLRMASSLEG